MPDWWGYHDPNRAKCCKQMVWRYCNENGKHVGILVCTLPLMTSPSVRSVLKCEAARRMRPCSRNGELLQIEYLEVLECERIPFHRAGRLFGVASPLSGRQVSVDEPPTGRVLRSHGGVELEGDREDRNKCHATRNRCLTSRNNVCY